MTDLPETLRPKTKTSGMTRKHWLILLALPWVLAGAETGRRHFHWKQVGEQHQRRRDYALSMARISEWSATTAAESAADRRHQVEVATDAARRDRAGKALAGWIKHRDEAKHNRELYLANAAYHQELTRKYDRASWHVWTTVPPDPMEPPLPPLQAPRERSAELLPDDISHAKMPPGAAVPGAPAPAPARSP